MQTAPRTLLGEMSTLSPAQTAALVQAAASSVKCELATKLPAELTVAQWALESGWGAHQPGDNCFGIKAYAGCFGVQRLRTIEVIAGKPVSLLEDFACFPSLDACFEKHAWLLTEGKPYQLAWAEYLQSSNLEALVADIARVYSTAPDYASLLLCIISMPEVVEALTKSRLANRLNSKL